MSYIKIIKSHLNSSSSIKLGKSTLIQKTPHIGSEAYLHSLYDGLTETEVAALEKSIGRKIPNQLKEFYKEVNGLEFFSGSIAIFGLRSNYTRDVSATWQPYDIKTPNIDERPKNATNDMIFFGAYDWDGSYLFLRSDDTNVHRCERDSNTPINSWKSLEEFFSAEIVRIGKLFNSNGSQKNSEQPTVPQ